MARNTHYGRVGGVVFAAGGALTLVGNAIHPTGGSSSYHDSFAQQLANPIGTPANWLTLVGSLLMAWGLWVLLEEAWQHAAPIARMGTRLAIIASTLMVVESAAALAMRTAVQQYASGAPVPMVRLSEVLYAGCLPALMLGLLLLNLGSTQLAPTAVRVIGAVGMVALGLAGPLVDGLHIIAVWPLYLGGVLACIWVIWAGVHQAIGISIHQRAQQKVSA